MDLEGFNVILVRSKATHVWHKGMKSVSSALKSLGVHAEWMKPEEILDMTLTSKTVLVMADFSCDHFDNFTSSECLVVGPDCLLECIDNKISIPNNCSPVFNLAMSDMVITCTNMPKKKKEELKRYIGWMGGCYTNTFTLAHTHLLAESVNSEKCYAAAEIKKPIMHPDWVTMVWQASLEDAKLRADKEDLMSSYRLATFKGLEITLSNLNTAAKRKYKKIIEENGGVCVGSLTQKQTHFVVTDKCEGEKVKCALAWGGVHVVNLEWLEKSVECGGPLPPQSFSFKQRPTCSTPNSELPSFMSAADISAVGGPNSTTGSSQRIEETMNNTAASVASFVPIVKPVPVKMSRPPNLPVVPPSPAPLNNSISKPQPPVSNYDRYKTMVDDLKPADISKAGTFLDGCKIYLSDWNATEGDKLRRSLIKGGATVLTKLSRAVTHIVAGQLPHDHQELTDSGSFNIVSVEWVLASLEKGQPAQVGPYLLAPSSQSKPPPPSPLSHKGLELLKSRGTTSLENGERGSPSDLGFQPPSVLRKLFAETPKKKLLANDVFELNKSNDEGGDVGADVAHQPPPPTSQKNKEHTFNTQKSTMSDTTNIRVFQGLVFTILGFDSANAANMVEAIEAQSGTIVPPSFQGVPDYAVLPIEGVTDKFTATEVVNAVWIEDCLEQGCLVDIRYYHQPVSIVAPGVPLSSAIVCFSGFYQKEKDFLFDLARILGAQVQEAFSRKDNPAKGVLRSTHLVSCEPSGSKFEAAIKWGIPVVNKAWLTEAACKSTESSLPPYQPYVMSKLQPNQDDIESTPVNAKPTKSICTVTPASSKSASQFSSASASHCNKSVAPPQQKSVSKSTPSTNQDAVESFVPPSHTSDQAVPENSCGPKENHTPVSTKTISITKDARASSSMFPTLGGDEMSKFNVSLNGSGANQSGLKRRSGDRSPLKEQNNPQSSQLFNTPINHHSKIARLSESSLGNSPFHVDTPETPLGKVLYSNPDKNTTKMYKKFIDSFPEFKQDSPLQLAKKSSPPIHVLRKQILAQLGGDVEGIEKGTGKLLKGGIYSEWANNSTDSLFNSPVATSGAGNKVVEETPLLKKKSPGDDKQNAERRKSSTEKVTELMTLMAEIQKGGYGGDQEDSTQPKMEQRILERLQADPNQELNDIKSHPLNKIRPNSDNLLDAERPSTSSMDKGDRGKSKNAVDMSRVNELTSQSDKEGDETQPVPVDDGTPTQLVPKRMFMLSSLPVDCKEKYEGLIRGLGGEVLTNSFYEEESTHLVIETPVRNEKLLCCIASGKWILHTSYLDQCYERRCFIPEEGYEWGNPLSESRLPKLEVGSAKDDLAKAAYRWRKNCSNINQRAFRHMKAMLISRDLNKAMFTRLLKSGGATVVEEESKCNICLVEEGKVELDAAMLESLASRSVPCVPLIYLNVYLVNYPKVNPVDYLVQQYISFYKKK